MPPTGTTWPFFTCAFHAVEDRRVMLLHPPPLLGLRAGKDELGVLLAEGSDICKSAGAFANRLPDGPQPGRVDVGVPDGRDPVRRTGGRRGHHLARAHRGPLAGRRPCRKCPAIAPGPAGSRGAGGRCVPSCPITPNRTSTSKDQAQGRLRRPRPGRPRPGRKGIRPRCAQVAQCGGRNRSSALPMIPGMATASTKQVQPSDGPRSNREPVVPG